MTVFIDDMADKSVSTVRNYLWAVSRLHLAVRDDDRRADGANHDEQRHG